MTDTPPGSPASIYERIKAMATTFRLRPGERINEVELARQLGVSRTPVREALARVAAEGFLIATPTRGFTMRALDAQQLLSLYEYRATVELGVVRLVCARASDEALAELLASAEQNRDEPDTDAQAIGLLWRDEAFHERLATLADNPEFLRSVRSLNERLRFARWMDLRARRSHTRNDHPDIVRALMARDLDHVEALMRHHINHHLDHLIELTRLGYAEIYMGNALADYAETARAPGDSLNRKSA
ncbi:GntR family transcriptional regulator [Achromobacter spanius]|uniref:GntR family transcriptional regulator n=1 Tax=Achromobacter spanius TaxID=217203 RepID=UPI00320AB804